jgi:hypothetical protein
MYEHSAVKLSTIMFNENNTKLGVLRGDDEGLSARMLGLVVDNLKERAASTFRVWYSENLLETEGRGRALLDTA